MLARQAVTLDHLSGGRFELGIGSGSTPASWTAFGCRRPRRRRERLERLRETLELLTAVLDRRAGRTTEGSFFRVEGARQLPVPLGRIPIVVGGTGPTDHGAGGPLRRLVERAVQSAGAARRGASGDAGAARVSVQLLVTLVTDERRRDEVARDWRHAASAGWARPAHLAGIGVGARAEARCVARQGVERVYAWFTDFAPPDTLAAFGREVIAALAGR